MNLKGQFVRREGTGVVFSSRKGEWKPIDLSGNIDPSILVPGKYYELDLRDNRLMDARPLAERTGGGGGYTGGGRPRQDPAVIPRASLMASATGFAKSMLDNGRGVEDAIQGGIEWARRWDPDGAPDHKHPTEKVVSVAGQAQPAPPRPWDEPPPADGPPPWMDQ